MALTTYSDGSICIDDDKKSLDISAADKNGYMWLTMNAPNYEYGSDTITICISQAELIELVEMLRKQIKP